jgi:ribonucleotide reductase beta subunit family protein with ferritin-like domain
MESPSTTPSISDLDEHDIKRRKQDTLLEQALRTPLPDSPAPAPVQLSSAPAPAPVLNTLRLFGSRNSDPLQRQKIKDEIQRKWKSERMKKRYTLFPIANPDVFQMYKDHFKVIWRAEEIDLIQDLPDWEALKPEERHFILIVLAFFAGSDGIVVENLIYRFLRDAKDPESVFFYTFQAMMENIHSETYSLLIDTYLQDDDEKDELFNAIENIPCVAAKAAWTIQWIDHPTASFAQRLVGMAIVEGVFFSGSFCSIFWFKKRGKLPGLTFSNELISRDEGMHCEHAQLQYNQLPEEERLPQETVHEMFQNAVDIETDFVCEALPLRLIGMNAKQMSIYIRFVANRLLAEFGYEKIWKNEGVNGAAGTGYVENPFEWMDMISMPGKTNQFEKRVGEYRRVESENYATQEAQDFAMYTKTDLDW